MWRLALEVNFSRVYEPGSSVFLAVSPEEHCHCRPQMRDLVWRSRTQRGLCVTGLLTTWVIGKCCRLCFWWDQWPAPCHDILCFPRQVDCCVLWDSPPLGSLASVKWEQKCFCWLWQGQGHPTPVWRLQFSAFPAAPFASGARNLPDLVANNVPGDSHHHLLLFPLAEQSASLSYVVLPSSSAAYFQLI